MEEIIKLIADYGSTLICIAYLIYFQSTTMKEMLNTLNSIDKRLTVIEEKQ